MRTLPRTACCFLLLIQVNAASSVPFAQSATSSQPTDSESRPVPETAMLEDGTPVKLRVNQTVSSADAHVNDRVEFRAVEDVKVSDFVIIPKGGIAWGTVTMARPKRRLGRGGKLEIVMDSVRLADGERAELRATKDATGGGHVGAMTVGIVAAGVFFFPVAPLFLLVQGKDIKVPNGTEVPTFVKGGYPLDLAKFQKSPAVISNSQEASAAEPGPVTSSKLEEGAQIEVTSIPTGAEIQLDGVFVGNTPSTFGVPAGDHDIAIRKTGFKLWERKTKVTTGKVMITAELSPGKDSTPTPQ